MDWQVISQPYAHFTEQLVDMSKKTTTEAQRKLRKLKTFIQWFRIRLALTYKHPKHIRKITACQKAIKELKTGPTHKETELHLPHGHCTGWAPKKPRSTGVQQTGNIGREKSNVAMTEKWTSDGFRSATARPDLGKESLSGRKSDRA
jgi:hypothetical protein